MRNMKPLPDRRPVPHARLTGPIATILPQVRALAASQQYLRNQQDAARGIAT